MKRLLSLITSLVVGVFVGYQVHKHESDIVKYMHKLPVPSFSTPAKAETSPLDGIKFGTPTFKVSVPITDPFGQKWECTQSIRSMKDFDIFDSRANPSAKFIKPEPSKEEPAAPSTEEHSIQNQQ
jgi:hypothetical protein